MRKWLLIGVLSLGIVDSFGGDAQAGPRKRRGNEMPIPIAAAPSPSVVMPSRPVSGIVVISATGETVQPDVALFPLLRLILK